MTQIELLYDGNLVIGFNMEGHAQYNVNGPDILCSSLSTSSQMTLNGILDWTGLSIEEVVKEYNTVKGILNIEVPKPFYENVTVQQLFKMFTMFIEQLEHQYIDNIKVERRQKE